VPLLRDVVTAILVRFEWHGNCPESGTGPPSYTVHSSPPNDQSVQQGDYNKTYGSLGAVIGFMTWIWISIVVVLVGAKLNAEMEHQTIRESTIGRPKPLGKRGARMADTVGATQA
jgi:hypothetical protein